MNTFKMNSRRLWSRCLKVVGCAAIIVMLGPFFHGDAKLAGLVLIVPGSGLIALADYLGGKDRKTVLYWLWVFILTALGVASTLVLTAIGGIGGPSGHSMWWGLPVLLYPVGCLMALAGGVVGLVRFIKS